MFMNPLVGYWKLKNDNEYFRIRTLLANNSLPHFDPERTGQAAWRVNSLPSPLGWRLYQKAALPFFGHTVAPVVVKTVAPPASTSLICQWGNVFLIKMYRSSSEIKTHVKQPSSDTIPPSKFIEDVIFCLLTQKEKAQKGTYKKNEIINKYSCHLQFMLQTLLWVFRIQSPVYRVIRITFSDDFSRSWHNQNKRRKFDVYYKY